MQDASRPEEVVALVREEMSFPGKAKLHTSLEQDAERGRVLAHAPRGPFFSSRARAPLDFNQASGTQTAGVRKEVPNEPASMCCSIHRSIP